MSWTLALANWPELLAQLCTRFRHLDHSALIRFRGNRAKMNLYLAETHDLTITEAAQALDDWLAYSAERIALPDAA